MRFIGLVIVGFALGLSGCNQSKPTQSTQPDPSTAASQPSVPAPAPSSWTTDTTAAATKKVEQPEANSDALWKVIEPATTNVRWTYRNGEEANHCTILESLGGGIGILDVDNDGRPDVCATGGGQFGTNQSISGLPTALFRNSGNWQFVDCSTASHLSPTEFYTHGVARADFNNDGFDDVAITGYRGLMLWMGLGDGTFIEIASDAGMHHSQWSSSAAWADIDNDHDLDLYVADYVDWSFENHPACKSADGRPDICPPKSFSGLPHALYINQGNGQFQTADASYGLAADGKGLGVVIADLNNDGWVDIYVANDTTNNFLYLNQQGKFNEQGVLSGVALDDRGLPNGSMGVDVMDYNGDDQLDIWVCNYEDETFAIYRNMGQQHFVHASKAAGLSSMPQRFVAFGTACVDFDADGDEDVIVANGHVIKYPNRSPRKQLPLFLLNQKSRFLRQSFSSNHYLGQAHEGRGLATADFDGDGDLDVIISHSNEPLAMLSNEAASTRQLTVEAIGRNSSRDAIGLVATLSTDRRQYVRTLKGGGSYLSMSQRLIHFGWSEGETPKQLTLRWPGGAESVHELRGGEGHLVIVE